MHFGAYICLGKKMYSCHYNVSTDSLCTVNPHRDTVITVEGIKHLIVPDDVLHRAATCWSVYSNGNYGVVECRVLAALL